MFSSAEPAAYTVAIRGGNSAVVQSSERTLTKEPGAFSIGSSLPSPGWRAGTSPPEYCKTQRSHIGHHESGTEVAAASHSSDVGGLWSFSQCPYLLPGGLTTPAICPEADRTNLTGPL